MARRKPRRPAASQPWYAQGLRFSCTRCGKCCGGAPGYVWIEKDEVRAIARFLGLTSAEFLSAYCRRVFTRISLREQENYDCVFFGPQGCRVYPVRPAQCTTFPFWPDNIKTPEDWENTAARCPGVGSGKLYSLAEIQGVSRRDRHTLP